MFKLSDRRVCTSDIVWPFLFWRSFFLVFIETETPVTEGSKGKRSGNESTTTGVSKGFSNSFD